MILLQFENKNITFKNPLKIIETSNINEIIQKIDEIEQEVNKGYYAAGYLSYEAGAAFHPFPIKSKAKLPLLWFAIFNDKSEIPMNDQTDQINQTNQTDQAKNFTLTNWQPTLNYAAYSHEFERIKRDIEAGNTYQVNYTFRMRAQFSGNAFSFYQQLAHMQKANYSAYIDTGKFKILCASPELFFKWQDGILTTRPMKGTIGRGDNEQNDASNREWLFQSDKNRSENLMIVDLLRNDLGKIAEIGSVSVSKMFNIEAYPTVFQMTSTVTAVSLKNLSFVQLFSALFPCGSITGAPKLSTLKIISEIEPDPREIYCGAIGYFGPNQEALFNVPIRTCWIDTMTGKAEYSVGGGITWDSQVHDEYNECFMKAKILTHIHSEFQLLETIRLEAGQYTLLQKHLKRLAHAAVFFNFPINLFIIEKKLQEYGSAHPLGLHKVRLLVFRNGNIEIESSEIEEIIGIQPVYLASQPIISQNDFLYHKTTQRQVYAPFKKQGFFDCLLWNERDELTEFTTGNLVLLINGEKLTPPLTSGVLAGIMRETLISKGEISEKLLMRDDLNKAHKIWYINSVRGMIEVNLTLS